MSPAELLLLLLLGDGHAEIAAAARLRDPVCAPGVELAAILAPEPGLALRATATLRSEGEVWSRFALTPQLGVVRYRDPWPAGGTQWNALVALRAEWACTDHLVVVLDARHVSNGRTILRHGHDNPGDDRAAIGIGGRW